VTDDSAAGTSYAAAGVDIAAGERAVELMKSRVAASHRPEVVEDVSGFAGLFDVSALKRFERPLLATSTDGVGTKVDLARRLGVYDTIGHDLVGMVVDDLVVCGAEPLFMTDYIACGRVVPERIAAIVGGIAEACALAGCALVGGETAEHPGLLGPDEFDVAGAGTGAYAPVTWCWGWPRPGSTPTATPWSGTSCARATCRWRRRRRSWAGRWARSCSPRPGSTPRTAWP
jgi:phosphoribosylformylglycinamidine cyclo-ligase